MRLRAAALSVLMLMDFLACQKMEASPLTQTITSSESERNEKATLKYLWPVLKSEGLASRIYYQTACQPDDKYFPPPFPLIDVQPPAKGRTGLAAVRDIFRNDSDVTITEDKPGVIRIRIGSVPDAILRTKIRILTLAPLDQYNPILAINAVENAPEVRAAMGKLGVRVPLMPYNTLVVQPAEGLTHLPPSLTDVTMDQALDVLAKTFKGIVLYGVCSEQRLFYINFTGGVYFDDRWLNTEGTPR